MNFDNDIITFLTGVSRPIAIDQYSRIIYLIYLMLISLFSSVVFNVSVCLLYYLPTSICNIYVIN